MLQPPLKGGVRNSTRVEPLSFASPVKRLAVVICVHELATAELESIEVSSLALTVMVI